PGERRGRVRVVLRRVGRERASAGDRPRSASTLVIGRAFLLRCAPLTHSNTCYTSSVILGLGVSPMRRRDFIALVGSSVAGWPLAARAQQLAMPVVGFVNGGAADAAARYLAAFRKGLSETGFVEGRNVAVEYHWMEGRYDRIPTVIADLVRRQVTVIT